MNKIILVLFIGVVLFSCKKQTPEDQLKFINGYWEIDMVEVSKDSMKDYKYNGVIDYFELNGQKGFRKKLRPQFDGTYHTTGKAEEINAIIEDDSLHLHYTTPFDSRKETLIQIDDEKMSIINPEGIIYHYKKFTPLLQENEKE